MANPNHCFWCSLPLIFYTSIPSNPWLLVICWINKLYSDSHLGNGQRFKGKKVYWSNIRDCTSCPKNVINRLIEETDHQTPTPTTSYLILKWLDLESLLKAYLLSSQWSSFFGDFVGGRPFNFPYIQNLSAGCKLQNWNLRTISHEAFVQISLNHNAQRISVQPNAG